MRVTQNTNFNTVTDTIHRSKARLEEFQKKASTLKNLNQPSDDPIASAKILEVRTDRVNNDQFRNNADMAQAFLYNSDHGLQELADIVMRAKDIAINQSSGASATADTRLGVAEEVTQLLQRAIGIANSKVGDRYLFGGFKTDRPPIDESGRYQGDDGEMMSEISKDVFLAMNIPGVDLFNTEADASRDKHDLNQREGRELASINENSQAASRENINLFQELSSLRVSLLTDNLDGIRNTLERMDDLRAHLVSMRSKVGSRVQALEGAVSTLERQDLTNASLGSKLEDADMVEVMNNMAREETILRTVLGSSERLVQPTLMDFLR